MKDKATDAPEQEAIENPIENTENQTDNQNFGDNPESSVVQELQKQLEESRNKYLYLFSDYETLKRNAARERLELISTAGRDIMSAMLPILDDFDRAAKNNALTEGTALIHQKLTHTLKSKGLSSLEAKAGDDFDPDQHEAVAEIPVPSDDAKGKIVDILEQGYTLGGKIIRHAKVVVGK
ncbi:MAG TPA: nucleotide exchange factor GrpE [Saprospiraceae bacterium]|nr:nucleotide exchange factor GrpE [Saprospiraceae bacterium]